MLVADAVQLPNIKRIESYENGRVRIIEFHPTVPAFVGGWKPPTNPPWPDGQQKYVFPLNVRSTTPDL